MNVLDLINYLAGGVLTPGELASYLDGLHVPPANLFPLTLEQFGEMQEAENDIAALNVLRGLENRVPVSWDTPAAEYLHDLAALRGGCAAVKAAFDKIPRPALSGLERAAGYGGADGFGLFGVVDLLARRQGLTDAQAKKITVANAIGKLTIDAMAAIRERRLMDMQRSRARR